MKSLTSRQQLVLDVLKDYISKHGEAPTLTELQEVLEIKTKRGVVKHLEALDKKGFIYRTGEPRGIKITDTFQKATFQIPIYGYANAGTPLVFAQEEIIGSIYVDKKLISKGDGKFGLIVKGDSMNIRQIDKVAIQDKNFVIIDKNAEFRDGDVVLAVIDDAATIKTFKKSANSVILYPESNNPVHTPIYLSEDSNAVINGKVIAVLENPS